MKKQTEQLIKVLLDHYIDEDYELASDFLEDLVIAGYGILSKTSNWEGDLLEFTHELNRVVVSNYIHMAKSGEINVEEIHV